MITNLSPDELLSDCNWVLSEIEVAAGRDARWVSTLDVCSTRVLSGWTAPLHEARTSEVETVNALEESTTELEREDEPTESVSVTTVEGKWFVVPVVALVFVRGVGIGPAVSIHLFPSLEAAAALPAPYKYIVTARHSGRYFPRLMIPVNPIQCLVSFFSIMHPSKYADECLCASHSFSCSSFFNFGRQRREILARLR